MNVCVPACTTFKIARGWRWAGFCLRFIKMNKRNIDRRNERWTRGRIMGYDGIYMSQSNRRIPK